MRILSLIVPIVIIFCACSNKENAMVSIPNLDTVRADLAFTCVHESASLPQLDPEAESLFRYGRYLHKRVGPRDYDEIARHYRIAAAHGHYKANHNLQRLLVQGWVTPPDAVNEAVDLAARLIEQGVPGGYFHIGFYLNIGYGLKQDKEMALRYFRKAADAGSPEAQFHVSELLAPWDKAPEVAAQLRGCASEQGHGEASHIVGIYMKGERRYAEAVAAFQRGVMAGDVYSASYLEDGFAGPPESDELSYMALAPDPERSSRYKAITQFIDRHEYRNPKVPDIDKIVPLPPAKLPPWDGTFEWEKAYDAEMASPAPKPSDELIARLCKEKNLDPATGLPIPPPPRKPLGTRAEAGEQCPESGVWCVRGFQVASATRTLRKGDVMPPLVLPDPRWLPILDDLLGERTKTRHYTWTLVAYEKTS